MSEAEGRCPTCGGAVRVMDSYQDYSTTRGPMTAYDITHCDACRQMHLRRRAAQSSRA